MSPPYRRAHGFTLVELVGVIVILAVLLAVAVPRLVDVGKSARVAALNALAGTVQSVAASARVLCKLNPVCDYSSGNQILNVAGHVTWMRYGWPEAGDNLGNNQIDSLIDYSGFTASLPNFQRTQFSLNGAPDPVNCAVIYLQSTVVNSDAQVTTVTSGC